MTWSLADLKSAKHSLVLTGINGFTNLLKALEVLACIAKATLCHLLAQDISAVRSYFEMLHRFEPHPRVEFTAVVLYAHFITLWDHYLAQLAADKFNKSALFQTFGANLWIDQSRIIPCASYIRFWVAKQVHGQWVESPFFRLIAREQPAQARLGQFAAMSARIAHLEAQHAGAQLPAPNARAQAKAPGPAPAPAPAAAQVPGPPPAAPAPAPSPAPAPAVAPFVATSVGQINLNNRQWAAINNPRLASGLPLIIDNAIIPWTSEFCYRCFGLGHHYSAKGGCTLLEHPRAFK